MSEGEPGIRVIDGRFELEARLGGGGMGMVWRARDLVLDRAVALKEVRPPDPGLAEYDPGAAAMLRERVLREARALARVDHPNVVTIHHVVDGGEHAYPWLVMELVTGGSLADRLAHGPMEPREAARLGREVLAALRAAHAAGIQHRDVKPANVLLRPDGRPVLTDFGIAAIRESTALTVTGSIIGTPDYMAPERISGADGGPESDLWSLAMMLYVAVEGDHPLRRGTTLATLAAVLSEELPPPRRAGVLAPVLAAVLVKDPAARAGVEAVDGLLATAAGGAEPPAANGDGGITSYPLAPPGRTAGASGASAGSPPAPYAPLPSPGFGPPSGGGSPAGPAQEPWTPSGGVPSPGAPTPYPAGPTRWVGPSGEAGVVLGAPGSAQRRERALRRRLSVAVTVVALLTAGVVVWSALPDREKKSPDPVASGLRSPVPSVSGGTDPVGDDSGTEPVGDGGDDAPEDLLTPDGIRTAVKALKEASGSDRMARFSVYPEHVSASVMLKGSKSRYDSWTYRAGEGAKKGIISGSVTPLESPFGIDDFNWDAVPGLLKQADKKLNVKDVKSRYLLVEGDDPTFGDPKNMKVYLSNAYSQSGYLEADAQGKVIKVMPNTKED
ncbi:serine/threonine-protein kinase [Streptomyces sp. NPDC005805]|uniref:serine/threonine-protein kinase n=1 Tax=Streptomyces sp. NPDC005805 TaxID=3157068 RepID=UPI0033D95CEE